MVTQSKDDKTGISDWITLVRDDREWSLGPFPAAAEIFEIEIWSDGPDTSFWPQKETEIEISAKSNAECFESNDRAERESSGHRDKTSLHWVDFYLFSMLSPWQFHREDVSISRSENLNWI